MGGDRNEVPGFYVYLVASVPLPPLATWSVPTLGGSLVPNPQTNPPQVRTHENLQRAKRL